MSQPRRRSGRSRKAGDANTNQAGGEGRNANARKGRNARKGGNSRNGNSRSGNARRAGNARKAGNRRQGRPSVDSFWRATGDEPRTAAKIRPTTDPAALPRSLGEPPLAPDTAAPHHLAVVYEEAVRTATALAAANGLLEDGDPDEDPPASDGSSA